MGSKSRSSEWFDDAARMFKARADAEVIDQRAHRAVQGAGRIAELQGDLELCRSRIESLENGNVDLKAENAKLKEVKGALNEARAEAKKWIDLACKENDKNEQLRAAVDRARADNAKLSNRVAELEAAACRPLRRDHPALAEERRQAIELVHGFENGAKPGSESDVALTVARAALEEWDRKHLDRLAPPVGVDENRSGLVGAWSSGRSDLSVRVKGSAPGVIDAPTSDQVHEMIREEIRSERGMLIDLLRDLSSRMWMGHFADVPTQEAFIWLAGRLEDQSKGEFE